MTITEIINYFFEEYFKGTAGRNATATGTVNMDLATFIDYKLTLTGNTTITVTNTPAANTSFVRNLTVTSSSTQTLTLPGTWNVYGEYVTGAVRNKLTICFSNFPTDGLQVDCFISQNI